MKKQDKRILQGLMNKWDKLEARQGAILYLVQKGEKTPDLVDEYHRNEKDIHEIVMEFTTSVESAVAK